MFSPRGPPKLLSRIIINWISRDEGLFVARSVRLSARTGSQGENLRTYLEIPFISKTDGLLLLARRELVFHQSAIHSCGVHNCLHRKSHLLTNFVTCPQQFPRIIPRARSSSSVFHFRTVLCHFSNENWPNPLWVPFRHKSQQGSLFPCSFVTFHFYSQRRYTEPLDFEIYQVSRRRRQSVASDQP